MGLLDIKDSVDDFAFANFDSSFSPPAPLHTPEVDEVTEGFCNTAGYSLESVATHTSTSTSSSTKSTTSSRKGSISGRSNRKIIPKSNHKSFDLFGQDEELQSAEPRIGFCDICLKHCNIHDTGATS